MNLIPVTVPVKIRRGPWYTFSYPHPPSCDYFYWTVGMMDTLKLQLKKSDYKHKPFTLTTKT